MNRGTLLAIEIIWIILGFLCLVIAVREIFLNGISKAWPFLIMAVAAFIMARIRDHQRKKQ